MILKNLLKQAVNAGIEAAKKDQHVRKVVSDAIHHQEFNKEEGAKIFSDLKKKIAQSTEEWKEVADTSAKKYIDGLDLAKQPELIQTKQELEERIRQLEERVAALENQLKKE